MLMVVLQLQVFLERVIRDPVLEGNKRCGVKSQCLL